MRTALLEQLKMIMDFDSADFYLAAADDSGRLVNQVTYNCDEDGSSKYSELDYSRGIMYSGKSMVYRETDIISDEKRVETEYYRKVYKPNSWHYISINTLKKHILNIYRKTGVRNRVQLFRMVK